MINSLHDLQLHVNQFFLKLLLVLENGIRLLKPSDVDIQSINKILAEKEWYFLVVDEDDLFTEFDGKGETCRKEPRVS